VFVSLVSSVRVVNPLTSDISIDSFADEKLLWRSMV
jgi:hypothetical protein